MLSFLRASRSGALLLHACKLLVLALWLAGAAVPAHAGVDDAFNQIREYEDAMVDRVTDVVESDEVNDIANTFFLVMALALFVLKCTAYALRGFDLADMFQTMMQIMITGFMMVSFTVIVPAIFNAALYVGQALLAGLGGLSFNSNEARDLPSSLVAMLVKYGGTIGPECDVDWYNPFSALDCIKNGVISVVATFIMTIIIGLLCIAVTLVDIWGFWLYAIALALGKLLVPFTLYRRLSFLFDGWLRFYFGALVYLILAQVNVALVAVAILTFLGTTVQAVSTDSFTAPAQPPIKDLADILGMVLFSGVGIFTLFATGRFAGAIVAGAGAGGLNFAKIASSVVRIVAAPVMIATTGVKGAVQGVKDKKASLAAQQREERAARRAARGGGSPRPSNVPARNRPPPPAPSLSFGQFIGAAAGGMARAYRDAGLRSMNRNRSFRRGYNFVKGGNSSNGGRGGGSRDRHTQAQMDADRWMQDNTSSSGAGT